MAALGHSPIYIKNCIKDTWFEAISIVGVKGTLPDVKIWSKRRTLD